jgi:hypothetical protein
LSEIIVHTAKAKSEIDLNEIDVELEWIQGIWEQIEFLNFEMKRHGILFRVQRRKFLMGEV